MAMEPHPRHLEQIRIGGGYDSAPDGGIDIEKNGDIKTNGDVLVDGNVSVGAEGGVIWYDATTEKLHVGTRDENQTPTPAVEIDKGATGATLLGDSTVTGNLAVDTLTVESMTTAGLVRNSANGELTGGHTFATADLPPHTHTSAQQGGDYPWADITGFGASGASTLTSRDDHVQSVNKGGTGLLANPSDGQLLIGKSATNGYALANLDGTANRVSVTNGSGTITLSAPQDIHTAANPTFNNLTLTGRLTQSGQFQGVSTEGLVALFHCENAATLLDWTGNGNTLTAYNGPSLVPGKYGSAIAFTASNQFFSGPSTLPDTLGQSDMTYSFWCCGPPPTTPRYLTPWYADAAHYISFLFQPTGFVAARFQGGAELREINSGMSIADGCWHHIVLTRIYSSPLISSFSLYVDGEIRGTVNPTDVEDVALGATNLNVGHPWGSSPLFTFDEVLIWNRALSAQEVKSLSMVTGEITGSYGNKLVHGTLAVHGNLTLFQPNVEISVSLPTSCPGSGKLWNDNGTVKIGI